MSPERRTRVTGAFARVPRWVFWVVLGVAALVVVAAAVGVAVFSASRPAYFARYHTLERSYSTLQSSAHKDLRCSQCHRDARGTVVYGITLVGEFYRGLFGRGDAPVFVKLAKPSRQACLSCHLHDWSWDARRTARVPHPAHLRVNDERRDCVGCHKWVAHEETYSQKHKQMPFSTVCASFGCHVGWKTTEQCGSCHHSLQEGKGDWKIIHRTTVQAFGPNGCLESCHTADQCQLCHTTGKTPKFTGGGVQASVTAIEREHVKKNWIAKHGTFALADQSKCLVCHVSEGECQDCHSKRPAFHNPASTWLARHKTLAKDERRCLTCHEKKWCDACHKQFKETR